MKFSHLADCHVGGWKEDKLKELSIESFEKAIEISIKEQVEFVLIAGDLFDNAMPSIDILKRTTHSLRKLYEHKIPVYVIHGSHDYSVSGKTMLDVLEKAGLMENVCKLTDSRLEFTNFNDIKITGLIGKRSSLELEDFRNLNIQELEKEQGFKIFMFHTGIEEFKPTDLKEVKCTPLTLFPKGFNYYAGGHIHYIFNIKFGQGILAYPGPLFPNNIRELEQLGNGGFYIVNINDEIKLDYRDIKLKEVETFNFRVDNKTPEEIESLILENITDVQNKIVILKIEGKMKGQPSQIDFKKIYSSIENPYAILRITSRLEGDQFKALEINLDEGEDFETSIIKNYKELNGELIKKLIQILDKEKDEGERVSDFESTIIKETTKTLGLE